MRDLDARAVLLGEPFRELLSERDAAVASPGATDRHREIALPFALVLRQEEGQQRLEPLEELLRLRPPQHPLGHPRFAARMRLETCDEVLVREEADVDTDG